MLRAALAGGRGSIAWQILGNGEYNTDPIRGPLNAGGLAGEIAGWQKPEFSDAAWAPATLPASPAGAGVTWYRAHVPLQVSVPPKSFAALRIDDAGRCNYRAFIFVNGWLVGQYRSDPGSPRVFPVPAGILKQSGDNVIAIAAWSLDGKSALGRVSFTTVGSLGDAHRTLADIPEVRAAGGVARLSLDVVAEGKAGRPHFVYQGRDVAPTIRIRPGETIDITLHNRLPVSRDTANAVNLHFHGLDVAPTQPGDDALTTLARPGASLHYTVHVLKSQPPGLYWYHPHAHGETYWQVTSGMAGAIVVEGLRDRVRSLAGMRERIIVVRDVQDAPNILAIPWYARKMTPPLSYAIDADDNAGPNRACLPEVGLHLTVNGTVQPAIDIDSGERQLFGVLNASASRVLDLAIDNERLGIVAIDGYPVGAYPGNPPIMWADHVIVPPAGRAEFVAIGQSGPTLLRSRCYDSGEAGDRDPQAVLAILRPSNLSAPSAVPIHASMAVNAGDATISPAAPVLHRTVALTEDSSGFFIDGRAFSMKAPPAIVARAGTLEEWTIRNDTGEVHDIHIHQVHFLVESLDGAHVNPPAWRDTVLVPAQRRIGGRRIPGTARILVDFRNPAIRGTFVFHCHMLDHEDGGMMATIRVI
ncbi:MAG: multicopper oxidase domain-containing protein [Candidatus Cybelea sp.]